MMKNRRKATGYLISNVQGKLFPNLRAVATSLGRSPSHLHRHLTEKGAIEIRNGEEAATITPAPSNFAEIRNAPAANFDRSLKNEGWEVVQLPRKPYTKRKVATDGQATPQPES